MTWLIVFHILRALNLAKNYSSSRSIKYCSRNLEFAFKLISHILWLWIWISFTHLIAVLQISKNVVTYISTADISIWFIKDNTRLILLQHSKNLSLYVIFGNPEHNLPCSFYYFLSFYLIFFITVYFWHTSNFVFLATFQFQ